MKEKIFNLFVEKITKRFDVTKEELFIKTKEKRIIHARQMLYFLCYNRPINITLIRRYMEKGGYKVHISSIIFGVRAMQDKIEQDNDFQTVAKEIQTSVFI
jgi:chromosomal replication initiation ATPase DnaA